MVFYTIYMYIQAILVIFKLLYMYNYIVLSKDPDTKTRYIYQCNSTQLRSYLFKEVQLCSFVINITESMNFNDTSFRRAFTLWYTCIFLDRRIWANIHLTAMMMQRRFLLTSFLSFVQIYKLGIVVQKDI